MASEDLRAFVVLNVNEGVIFQGVKHSQKEAMPRDTATEGAGKARMVIRELVAL